MTLDYFYLKIDILYDFMNNVYPTSSFVLVLEMTDPMTKEHAMEIQQTLEQIRQTGETSLNDKMCEKMDEMMKAPIQAFQFTVLHGSEMNKYISWLHDNGYNTSSSSYLLNVIYAIIAYIRTQKLTDQEKQFYKSLILKTVEFMLYNGDYKVSHCYATFYMPYDKSVIISDTKGIARSTLNEYTILRVTQGTASSTLDKLHAIYKIFINEKIPVNLIQEYFPQYINYDITKHIENTCITVFECAKELCNT